VWTASPFESISVRLARGHEAQAIGRSRRGLTTKIHAVVDALGNPVRLKLAAGQVGHRTDRGLGG